jgi:DMSO reductase family type II enzyme chaperone
MKNREMGSKAIEERRSRQAAIRGLARGFSYPDAQWVESLLSGEWVEAFRGVLEPLGASSKGLEGAIAALPAEPAVAVQALQVEYTHLFINAIPHVPVPPYASAYVGQGMLMNEPAEAALRAYRHAGLDLAEDYHDLPDHLAVELEFLSWLEERAIEAYEERNGERAQVWTEQKETFLSQQVQPWLPEFCRRVEEAARIPFYPELAKLVKLFLGNIHEPGQT